MLAPLPYALRILLIRATRCGGEGAADELIEFLQRGCGAAPRFDVGLGQRNNELNELRNCCAEGGGEGGIKGIYGFFLDA